MKKAVVVTMAVWMAGFASTAVVIHQIRRPLGPTNTVNTMTAAACEPVEQADLAGHHHRRGDRYRVSINLGLPGRELLVSRAPADERDAESARASADRAFDEAERQLEDWVRRARAHRREGRPSA